MVPSDRTAAAVDALVGERAASALFETRSGARLDRHLWSRYFTLDQAIADIDEDEDGIFRMFAPDFLDLVIVDERHRGSASLESSWRRILEAGATAHPQAPLIRFDRPYRGVREQTA